MVHQICEISIITAETIFLLYNYKDSVLSLPLYETLSMFLNLLHAVYKNIGSIAFCSCFYYEFYFTYIQDLLYFP